MSSHVISRWYRPPEIILKEHEYSFSADYWAIGCMLFTMIYGFLPFYSSNERDLIKLIKESPIKFPKDHPITPMGKEVIKAMLNKDPSKRIQLIDFVTLDYNTMSEQDFEKHYAQAQEEHDEYKRKADAEEEVKQHE